MDRRLPGSDAFKLHDTFGFPFDLTRELAQERAIQVDEDGFRAAMAEQRERSRAKGTKHMAASKDLPRAEFTGYGELVSESSITALRTGGNATEVAAEGDVVEVFLQRSPFYAESGGQVGDTGTITTPSGRVRVEDTQKPADGVIAHIGTVITGEIARRREGDRGRRRRPRDIRSPATTQRRIFCTRHCARRSVSRWSREAHGWDLIARLLTSRSIGR